LLRRLDEIDGLRWLRLLYAHPARVDEALAATMAQCRAVVPYLDLPLQHVSDRVLQAHESTPDARAKANGRCRGCARRCPTSRCARRFSSAIQARPKTTWPS
jgi:tRNA A37 methylthiotransferase MiaB